jgi:hypothetical protein
MGETEKELGRTKYKMCTIYKWVGSLSSEWERRGTCIGYWYESQRERDH